MNIASIIFVLCAGFPNAKPANLTPFAPFGADGVFAGAAVVFFAFVGEQRTPYMQRCWLLRVCSRQP